MRSALTARVRDLAVAGFLAAGVALVFHWLLYPAVADPDSFYHVGHARLYAATSIFHTAFPWTAFSAIATEHADLWWGFHVLLVPFAAFHDPATNIRVAAYALNVVCLLLVAWLAVRHRFRSAYLWPLVFFLAVPNVLFRYTAVRPEALSIPLALLLLSALAQRQPLLTLGLATAITWVHLSMFWLGPGIAVTWVLAVEMDRRFRRVATDHGRHTRWTTRSGLLSAVVGGTVLGWLLRPHPLGAARLAWIQIAKLLFEKTGHVPLTFAVELTPLRPHGLWNMAWPLFVPWCLALGALLWMALRRRDALGAMPPDERAHLWTTLLVAAGFLLLTAVVARRSLVYWAAFATVSLALVVTWLVPARRGPWASWILVAVLPLLFAYSVWRNAINDVFVAKPADTLEQVADWLAAHSRPGDLVFNTHWDTFGPLFLRNRVSYYVGGMDPIFQYARSPALYWEFYHLSTDQSVAVTCPDPVCSPADVRDTHTVLRRDFDARYVLVQPRRNPRLSRYLGHDPGYRLALETPGAQVFEVLPDSVSPAGAE